ncbi:MAG TPA: hypothetical protein DIW48_00675 [Sphaerochaeta sp.]|nr:hypothetical protein [Sphaerochaeta sp.]HCS35220.1 hypothetical protein [Sphaerochaeta sp.]
MEIPIRCPKCGKRAFDTTGFHQVNQPIVIRLKCPQCRQFVDVPIARDMCLPMKKGGSRVHIMNK